MPVVVTSLLLLVASSLWTVVAGLDGFGVAPSNLVMVTLSMWTATVAAVTGMLVARSRWARRLALVVCGGQAILAVLSAADGWWVAGLTVSGVAAVAVAGPWLTGLVRSLPAAAGPPARAVLVPLLLVGVPFALGLADPQPIVGGVVGFGALGGAFWFIRALPGALVVVRVGWPILALAGAWPMGMPATAVSIAAAVAVAVTAWHRSVATAVHPLVERGTVVPIPPELAPKDVLDAAGLDERGRPR